MLLPHFGRGSALGDERVQEIFSESFIDGKQVNVSCEPCGCDPTHKPKPWQCEQHRGGEMNKIAERAATAEGLGTHDKYTDEANTPLDSLFPASAQGRKDHPVFTGFLMYFPDAIAAVARVSKKGNDQHNPGQPLHWAREKSTDQMDTATRHMMDHGTGNVRDTDGEYHLAKAAWRICAELQLTIEKERGFKR